MESNTAIQLTPMQHVIELLKQERQMVYNEYRLSDDVQEMEELSHKLDGLDFSIKTTTKHLPKEQEAIEQAYKTGYTEKEYLDYYPDKHSKEYFTNTYGQTNT